MTSAATPIKGKAPVAKSWPSPPAEAVTDGRMHRSIVTRKKIVQLVMPVVNAPLAGDTWLRLRREQGLSAEMALEVVQHLVAGLIAGSA